MIKRLSDKNPCISWWRNYCFNQLKEYEALEEEGRLLVLPCKVGTTAYVIDYTWDYGEIGDKAERRYFIRETPFEYGMIDEFNKSVFLTREEAEKALEEMSQNNATD